MIVIVQGIFKVILILPLDEGNIFRRTCIIHMCHDVCLGSDLVVVVKNGMSLAVQVWR